MHKLRHLLLTLALANLTLLVFFALTDSPQRVEARPAYPAFTPVRSTVPLNASRPAGALGSVTSSTSRSASPDPSRDRHLPAYAADSTAVDLEIGLRRTGGN